MQRDGNMALRFTSMAVVLQIVDLWNLFELVSLLMFSHNSYHFGRLDVPRTSGEGRNIEASSDVVRRRKWQQVSTKS